MKRFCDTAKISGQWAGKVLAACLLTVLLLACVGCEEDEGLVDPPLPPLELPTTADDVVATLATALTRQDSVTIDLLTASDFSFLTDDHAGIAGTDSLERSRFTRAVFNLCRRGVDQPLCTPDGITAVFAEPAEWTALPGDKDPVSGILATEVEIALDITTGADCPDHSINGVLEFQVRADSLLVRGDTTVVYRLVGLRDMTTGCTGDDDPTCLTKLLCAYLPAGLPRAHLISDRTEGTTTNNYVLDAAGSDCSGLGLPEEPYRWRIGEHSLWSDWRAEPQYDLRFSLADSYLVTLEVRNTEGWVSQSQLTLVVHAQRPRSPEELLDTLAYGHRIQDAMLIGQQLDPTFAFAIDPIDVEDLHLPFTEFSFSRMLTAMVRFFRDDPGPGSPPLVEEVDFAWNAPYEDAAGLPTPAGASDGRLTVKLATYLVAEREASSTLVIDGNVELTMIPVRVVAKDGRTDEFWRLQRIVDLTYRECGDCTGNTSWGNVLGTYY